MKSKLEERKKVLEAEWAKLDEQDQSIVKQGSELQRKLSELRTEKIRLQGSFKEIEALLNDEPKEEVDVKN